MSARPPEPDPKDASLFKELSGHLALAGSDNEHEARNAAKKACDLIAKYDLVVVKREEIEWARGMLTAYQGCVMLAKDEYERLFGEITRLAAGAAKRDRKPRSGQRREVEGTIAEAAGNIVTSVVRGAMRRF